MPENLTIPQIKVNESGPQASPSVITPQSQAQQPQAQPQRRLTRGLWLKILIGILVLLILILIPSLIVFSKALKFKTSAQALVTAAQSQNLPAISLEIAKTKKSLQSLNNSYKLISWVKLIPLLGSYVGDLGHALKAGESGLEAGEVVLGAVEPYADILGFNGQTEEGKDGTKTAQERIDFIVKSIPDLVPKVDQITTKIAEAKRQLDKINPDHYPVRIGKREVRAKIKSGLDLFDQAASFVTNGKPLLEAAPYLLGIDEPRTYLVLFQNDKELRPTGGFMTAYSIMKVDKARFEPVASSDIYNLDAKYKPSLPAPEPIVKYIKGPYVLSQKLRLRDMNWSPDFSQSMQLFTEEAAKVGIKEIDGVISVDTQVLVYLLDVLGQIGVPGFGNFSTKIEPKCNCPNVIYELESFADTEGPIVWDPAGTGKIIYAPANYDNRKKIIGPLMNSIMANALGQPKDKLPKLFEAAFKSLVEKHVLFYLFDDQAQKAVADFNIAGTIKETEEDYLLIDDANLGGRKSNLYVTQEVEQEIALNKGVVEKTVTITYKNSEKQDGWLNSVLPNWVRIYVPKGSSLISFDGVEDKAEPYEDLGKTVFAGFFNLRPEGIAKVTVKYTIPIKTKGELKLYLQKQPGTDAPLYRIKIGKKEDEFILKTDKELKLRL
jgi:hypothetical protein